MTVRRRVGTSRAAVAAHYDRCSWLYERLWGEHIHHGYWRGDESVGAAQLGLVERLAAAARVPAGAEVLDAGCGLGGSSLWLARQRGCRVTGVTLSGVQARLARRRAASAGLAGRVSVVCADLETLPVRPASLDLVWAVESTEHFHDKAGFCARAAGWLRPGGAVAACAWTCADGLSEAAWRRHVGPVCRGFLCPDLASAGDYAGWLTRAGLAVTERADLTAQTLRTWEVCLERTNRLWVRVTALLLGYHAWRFLKSFPVILGAYRAGALRYTLLVARKPPAAEGGRPCR